MPKVAILILGKIKPIGHLFLLVSIERLAISSKHILVQVIDPLQIKPPHKKVLNTIEQVDNSYFSDITVLPNVF